MVEEVLCNRPVVRRVRGGRLAAYGQTDDGRYLTVIFHLKPGGITRVVTARDMSEWERRYYREYNGLGGEGDGFAMRSA